jgi:hypothetical protein
MQENVTVDFDKKGVYRFMVDLKGTSWQQRYGTPEIFTLRCRILDKPGMLGKLTSTIGQMDVNLGEINLVALECEYKVRDITVYLKDAKQLQKMRGVWPNNSLMICFWAFIWSKNSSLE